MLTDNTCTLNMMSVRPMCLFLFVRFNVTICLSCKALLALQMSPHVDLFLLVLFVLALFAIGLTENQCYLLDYDF